MGNISTLEYALTVIGRVHADEPEEVRTWAADLMTAAVVEHRQTIPLRFRDANLASLDDCQSPGRIRRWLENPDAQTLFLAGGTGVGKTHAAWAAVTEAVIDQVVAASRGLVTTSPTVGVLAVPDLLDELRMEGVIPKAWNTLRTTPLVGLDDLGAARPTPWALEKMWALMNARAANGLKQIVTTNSDWPTLVGTWGEPMMERLRDRSATIEIRGASRRSLVVV